MKALKNRVAIAACSNNLQTTTTATTLPSGRVRWNWGDILNSTNSDTRSGESSKSRLSTWTWSLGTSTTGSPELDVESSDTDFLASGSTVLSGQHGSVWRRLVSVSLDLHSTGNSDDGFLSGKIGDVDKGVVEGGKDSSNAKDELAFTHLWTEGDFLVALADHFWRHLD